MPLDGITLGFIARELNEQLSGARIERVTQPEKDMLLLLVRNNGKNHKLLISAGPGFARMHLTAGQFINPMEAPMFCMLMRKHISGGRIMGVKQLSGDRVLMLSIEAQDELGIMHPYEMYLEAMGRHSNLTLVRDGRIIDAIRHVTDDMSRVRQALPGLPFVPPPAQDKIAPQDADAATLKDKLTTLTGRLDKALQRCISGLSVIAAKELCYRMTGNEQTSLENIDINALCEKLSVFLKKLPSMQPAMLLTDETGLPADVFPFLYLSYPADSQRPMPSLSEALDAFYDGRDRRNRIQQRSASLRKLIKTHVERSEKKLALQEEELLNAEKMEDYRIMGELLTSQLHLVPKGAENVQLFNYYDGQQLLIPLDVRLSPSQNAQRYFKRYQKARAAVRLAAEQKEKTLRELEILENALCDLEISETEDDLTDVRRVLQEAGLIKKDAEGKKKQPKNQRQSAPMHFESEDGVMISVGKNALQNERLTQGARGDEIWLHAKDMPGSHVIIHSEGKPVSDATLLTAANLAAWFSKGKGLSVPVDCTLKKYVKKPSGTPTGFVTYTNQKNYLITVSEADIRAIKQLKNK
ncbi:MAG: NFACT family protein [Clostridia bacterium]|nr:NFACT family protein [Clostridia bacterium]